ncbi:unnamed protein product [Adineta steineri]|uniref:Uncharacterized protein n=1 Tax=Adineta steineri TaxID=433720 RepID=A0A819QZ70_9BILA|nr:unnamed protein product [Adineta steineri]
MFIKIVNEIDAISARNHQQRNMVSPSHNMESSHNALLNDPLYLSVSGELYSLNLAVGVNNIYSIDYVFLKNEPAFKKMLRDMVNQIDVILRRNHQQQNMGPLKYHVLLYCSILDDIRKLP